MYPENCTKCNLHKSRKRIVPGSGNLSNGIVWVGEAPGQVEEETGIPFTGMAGQILNLMFDHIGLPRDKIYITNVCKCRPPNNRTPTSEEMKTCMPHLSEELKDAKYIVLLGKTAIKAVLGLDVPITRDHGQVLHHGGKTFLLFYHPSFILRDRDRMPEYKKDFEIFRQLTEGHRTRILGEYNGKEMLIYYHDIWAVTNNEEEFLRKCCTTVNHEWLEMLGFNDNIIYNSTALEGLAW